MHKYRGAYESTKHKELTLRQPLEVARTGLLHKRSDLQRIQHEAVLLEAVLKKAQASNAANKDPSLGKTVDTINATLSALAEKRRSQVST